MKTIRAGNPDVLETYRHFECNNCDYIDVNWDNKYIENETGEFEISPNGTLISFFPKRKDVIIPNEVKIIGRHAITDFHSGIPIKSLFIPDSVVEIYSHGINSLDLESIECSSNIKNIEWLGIQTPNAKITIPELKPDSYYGYYRDPHIVCSKLKIGDFLFKNPEKISRIFFGYFNLTSHNFVIMSEWALSFITHLDNLQEILPYLDRKFNIFKWYDKLIENCIKDKLYENQMILTEYKHTHYPETIEEIIEKKFEL